MGTLNIPTRPRKPLAESQENPASPEVAAESLSRDVDAQENPESAPHRSRPSLDIPTRPRKGNGGPSPESGESVKRVTGSLDIPTRPRKRAGDLRRSHAAPRQRSADTLKNSKLSRKDAAGTCIETRETANRFSLAEKHLAANKLRGMAQNGGSAVPRRKTARTREIPIQPHQRIAIASKILANQKKDLDLHLSINSVVQKTATAIPKKIGLNVKEAAGIEGETLRAASRRTWTFLPLALLLGWVACLTIFLAWVIRVTIPPSVKVSLSSILRADYSADPRGWYFPSLDVDIIFDVLQGQDPDTAPGGYATLVSMQLTPVATVTPNGTTTPWIMPSPTSGITPTPTPILSVTPSFTYTPSPTASGTPIMGTPELTLTLTEYPGELTSTPQRSLTPTRRASATQTLRPIHTQTAEPATPTEPPTRTATRTRPPDPTQTSRPTNTRNPYPYP